MLAALMGVAFALIAPFGYPTHDVIMTFEPGVPPPGSISASPA
ncbi:MAG: hypothetical protein R2701_05375 [Acidimicrobiales bacterium]